MACNLTQGRAINCKDVSGGISAVYLTNFGGLGTITDSSDAISNMSGSFTIFRYDLDQLILLLQQLQQVEKME